MVHSSNLKLSLSVCAKSVSCHGLDTAYIATRCKLCMGSSPARTTAMHRTPGPDPGALYIRSRAGHLDGRYGRTP